MSNVSSADSMWRDSKRYRATQGGTLPLQTSHTDSKSRARSSAKKKNVQKQSTAKRAQAGKPSRHVFAKTGKKPDAKVKVVSSKLAYHGPLFDVYTDHVREPEGIVSRRDVIRHSGSVVILAVDTTRNQRDPLIVIERQYRHAAGQYMWEVPAGRREPEEDILFGAKRELLEETGCCAKRWTKLARFYVSPGFLGEWMQVYLAEGLSLGQSEPDDDEYIHHRQIPLSQAVQWVEKGKIIDAKSIIAILLYQRRCSG